MRKLKWEEENWTALSFTLICTKTQCFSDFSYYNHASGEDWFWMWYRGNWHVNYLPRHLHMQNEIWPISFLSFLFIYFFLQLCETPFDSCVTTPWLKLLGDHLGRKYKIPNAILPAQNFTVEFHWRKPYEEFTKNWTASRIKVAKYL